MILELPYNTGKKRFRESYEQTFSLLNFKCGYSQQQINTITKYKITQDVQKNAGTIPTHHIKLSS